MKIKNLFQNPFFILAILLVCYILSKLWILINSPDIVDFHGEEYLITMIAQALSEGLKDFSLFDYQYYIAPYYGGTLFDGIVTWPFVSLLGPIILAQKLAYLFMSTIIFIIFFLISNKFYDKKTAIIVSFLFIFSPYFFSVSVISQGGPHLSSALLDSIIAILFLYNFFYKPKTINIIFLGLVCGFALYSNPFSTMMVFTCFIFLFMYNKSYFLKKNFLLFLLFFLIGFSPFIVFNLKYDFPVINENHFVSKIGMQGENFVSNVFNNFIKLITIYLPQSFHFMIKGKNYNYLNYTYYTVFVISFFSLLYSKRKKVYHLIKNLKSFKRYEKPFYQQPIELFFITYVLIFIFIFSLTRFKIAPYRGIDGYRYLISIYPSIFFIIGLSIRNILKSNKKILKTLVLLIISLILIDIIFSQITYEEKINNVDFLQEQHIAFGQHGLHHRIGWKFALNNNTIKSGTVEACENLPEEENKIDCYWGFGIGISELNKTSNIIKCRLLKGDAQTICHVSTIHRLGDFIGQRFSYNSSLVKEICNNFCTELDIQICIFSANKYIGPMNKLGDANQENEKNHYTNIIKLLIQDPTPYNNPHNVDLTINHLVQELKNKNFSTELKKECLPLLKNPPEDKNIFQNNIII